MARRLSGLAAAAVVVVCASACEEAPPSAPQDAPAFKVTSVFACLFTGNPSLSNSAGAYFQTNDDRKAASGWIALMQDGYTASGPAGARDPGYSLLALAGAASRDPARAGDIDVGETMVKLAVNCMYDTKSPPDPSDFTGWPDDTQYDFSAALDAPDGGAFFVRGGGSDPATLPAVGNIKSLNTLADPAGGNVSAIAPPSTPTQLSWTSVLGNTRTLIYGNPVPDGFDWKLIGRNTPFSPYAVVALCQGLQPGGFQDPDVIHQESVGTIGFKESEALCGTLPSTFALGGAGGRGFELVSRLAAFAERVLSPAPLNAAAIALTKTIGGSASGAKADEFTVQNLPEVVLKFEVPKGAKNTTTVGSGRVSATVDVTTPQGEPAGGITVTLSSTTNNGTGTAIYEITSDAPAGYNKCDPNDPWVVTPQETTLGTVGLNGVSQPTKAVWDNNLCFTKTGSVQIIASSVADGNPAAGAGSATSVKIGVNP